MVVQVSVSKHYFAFIFLGTITAYNFIKYLTPGNTHETGTSNRLKTIWLFTFFCGLGMLYFLTTVSVKIYGVLAVLALLTFFYAIPLYKQKNLRQITGLKLFLVALVWAGVTVLLPVLDAGKDLSTEVWVLFLQRFLFIIALTIPFEIRDLKNDDLALGTVPQRMGIRGAKFLGLSLLFFVLQLNKFISTWGCNELGVSAISVILAGLILFSNKKQHAYFASFWVEAVPVFWVILVLICNYL